MTTMLGFDDDQKSEKYKAKINVYCPVTLSDIDIVAAIMTMDSPSIAVFG